MYDNFVKRDPFYSIIVVFLIIKSSVKNKKNILIIFMNDSKIAFTLCGF
jgi:hypothetical protein